MKYVWKNKKFRNIIIIALIITASLWGYQEFVRYSIKKQIYELTHIEGQPVAPYMLWVFLGNKCMSKPWQGNVASYRSKPKDVPIFKVLYTSLQAKNCRSRFLHMQLTIKQKSYKKVYDTPKGEITRYKDYYWSFGENSFVSLGSIYWGESTCAASFIKDYTDPNKEEMNTVCKNKDNYVE